jgi:ketosteroid isomerase-like protein
LVSRKANQELKPVEQEVKMKTHLIAIATLILVPALPLALYAQEADPAAGVTAAYEAWNAGDVDAYLALVADDAVVDIPGFGTHTGHEEIRAWMEGLIPLNPHMGFEILRVEGDTVTVRSTYTDDDFRALGVVLEADEVIVVQDGKVKSDTWIVTDESMAQLRAAMAALPETGGAPVSEYTLLLGPGCLAILGGLGLERLRRRSHQQR